MPRKIASLDVVALEVLLVELFEFELLELFEEELVEFDEFEELDELELFEVLVEEEFWDCRYLKLFL